MQTEKDNKASGEIGKLKNNNATAVNDLKEKHAIEKVAEAHEQADADMEQDPDLSMNKPNDDLDEGESARVGEGETPIV